MNNNNLRERTFFSLFFKYIPKYNPFKFMVPMVVKKNFNILKRTLSAKHIYSKTQNVFTDVNFRCV